MRLEASKAVGEIAVELPQSISFFEEKSIDYCCGGRKSLQEACSRAGVSMEEALQTLESIAQKTKRDGAAPWPTLEGLIRHLVEKHHTFTRDQLALAGKLGSKVLAVHGNRHPELAKVDRVFKSMASELKHHLLKEEQVAFPLLLALEKKGEAPLFPFGVFQTGPQQVLTGDHEATGEQLACLRRLTQGYTPPSGACVTFRAFYQSLSDLEADLHQHIHLENNVLFPMAERVANKL